MWRKKILNFRSYLFESKWKLLFDIYDPISKRSYDSLINVYLKHMREILFYIYIYIYIYREREREREYK